MIDDPLQSRDQARSNGASTVQIHVLVPELCSLESVVSQCASDWIFTKVFNKTLLFGSAAAGHHNAALLRCCVGRAVGSGASPTNDQTVNDEAVCVGLLRLE